MPTDDSETVTAPPAAGFPMPERRYNVLIPITDSATFRLVASEVARIAVESSGGPFTLIVDARTAGQVDTLEMARAAAEQVYVAGETPHRWTASGNLVRGTGAVPDFDYERFLLVLSSGFNFAVLGECRNSGNWGDRLAWGGWTAHRRPVEEAANAILTGMGAPPRPEGPAGPDAVTGDATASAVMHIMALHSRQTAMRHRDIAMDKDDLLSVLNILQAISAQRRAHDILYVFVERIARVIQMDRCSIMRVWGGDNTGHVLASHEDESVYDLVVNLDKYPEIRQALAEREKVIINDVCHDPLTRRFASDLRAANIASLLVIPIGLYNENVGSLFLRATRRTGSFTLREISFCEIVAEAAANALERGHLFESIQKANERLAYLAVTDGLTGLYNHRFFRERLQEEVERAKRYRLPLSCMIFDIDGFKSINDTYGHLQGDSILREMGARTLATVRKNDIVARYGGEEFVVIMPQTDCEGARANAERVLTALGTVPYRGMPPNTRVTVSIGVAVFNHEGMLEAEALLHHADSALYEAKRAGKNRVIIAPLKGGKT